MCRAAESEEAAARLSARFRCRGRWSDRRSSEKLNRRVSARTLRLRELMRGEGMANIDYSKWDKLARDLSDSTC